MRISSLVSALYEVSVAYKDEIKNAGGAKLWLSDHSDSFVVHTDCMPGQESVALRRCMAVAVPSDEGDDSRDGPMQRALGGGVPASGALAATGTILTSLESDLTHGADAPASHSDGSDDAEAAIPVRGVSMRSPSLTLLDDADFHDGDSYPFSWNGSERVSADAADDVAAAALLGAASEESTNDPILIEKKIRAVQKKLRRVQVIEELVAQGTSLDSGQQVKTSFQPSPPSSRLQ